MLLGVAYSHHLVPSSDTERLLATLRAFAGLAGAARAGSRRAEEES